LRRYSSYPTRNIRHSDRFLPFAAESDVANTVIAKRNSADRTISLDVICFLLKIAFRISRQQVDFQLHKVRRSIAINCRALRRREFLPRSIPGWPGFQATAGQEPLEQFQCSDSVPATYGFPKKKPLFSAVVFICRAAAFGAQKSLKVDVDLVLFNVSVTDAGNKFVSGLTAENFQVMEDKVEQTIRYFSSDVAPLSIGIIFDISHQHGEEARTLRARRATKVSRKAVNGRARGRSIFSRPSAILAAIAGGGKRGLPELQQPSIRHPARLR
jgi:hypothetical protein